MAGGFDRIDEKLLGVSQSVQGSFLFYFQTTLYIECRYYYAPSPPPPLLSCSAEINQRPNFADIVDILDSMVSGEKDGDVKKKKLSKKFVSALIDRHSTWF